VYNVNPADDPRIIAVRASCTGDIPVCVFWLGIESLVVLVVAFVVAVILCAVLFLICITNPDVLTKENRLKTVMHKLLYKTILAVFSVLLSWLRLSG
jgi:hypothetical protein